ncbi:hypothetical protein ACTFIY_005287 [Dictyostelium cf. discoideum]
MGSMLIGDDEYKWYPLNKNGGKLLDISVIRGTMNKIHYLNEFLQEMFAEEKLDGVIIKRNLDKEEFEGRGHSTCISALATLFFGANNYYQGGPVINQFIESSIRLEGGVTRQPDISLAPVGKVPPTPTVVVEVAISQSIRYLIDKCYRFFRNQNILMVIGVRIYPKQVDGIFKAIAFLITRDGLYGNAVSVVSFGSCRTTETDEQNLLNFIYSHQQEPQQINANILTGVLSTNNYQNNTPNDPQFKLIKNIFIKICVFYKPVPLPNTNTINLEIDLHFVKIELETTIENNLPFTSIFE